MSTQTKLTYGQFTGKQILAATKAAAARNEVKNPGSIGSNPEGGEFIDALVSSREGLELIARFGSQQAIVNFVQGLTVGIDLANGAING